MIEASTEGRIRILSIDRQDKANALTGGMLTDLSDAVEAANSDQTVNALILTGKGKVFSAGADLEAMQQGLGSDPIWERLSGAIASSPLLTIAALNGTAAGGALGMVLACDLRVAVPSANIFYPVMKLGFLPQPSDPVRMAALVGPSRARMILMGGQKISASLAQDFGLVDQQAHDVLDAARRMCADVVGADRSHVAGIKALFRPN